MQNGSRGKLDTTEESKDRRKIILAILVIVSDYM